MNNKIRCDRLCSLLGVNLDFGSREIQTVHPQYIGKAVKVVYFHVANINHRFDALKLAIFGEPRGEIELRSANIGSGKWYAKKYAEFKHAIDA